jgi:hypothetical protein
VIRFTSAFDKTHFISSDEPTDGRVQVGSLWSDSDSGELYICTSVDPITFTLLVGGSGAPVGASFLTLGLNGTLTSERVLTAGTGISFTDGGANSTLTINATGSASTSFWPSLMLGGM